MLIIRIATTPIVKPAGVVPGNWRFDIEESNGAPAMAPILSASSDVPWPTALPPATYRLKGRRVDAEGQTIGSVSESTYIWSGEGAEMVDVAAGISVVNV
jgi:hypothetical protein